MNRASLQVTYEGRDISRAIAPFITSFSYTDHDGGKADDLQISLEDCDGLWKRGWYPAKGAVLKASIHSNFSGKDRVLSCGTFAVDDLDAAGPPDTFTMKAVSSFTQKSLKREKKSKAWENICFEAIARDISNAHGLNFFYQVDRKIDFIRLDQREESDLAFLNRICRDYDLNLKISGEKLILFESRLLEQAPPVFSIVRGKACVGRYGFSSKTHDVFRACEVVYFDPESKTEKKFTFTPPDAPAVGQVLKVNQRVESRSAAVAKAESMLRRKNKQEVTGDFDLMGDTILLAGLTGTVAGWGVFDGKYIATKAVHSCSRSQGYRSNIKIRKVLGW